MESGKHGRVEDFTIWFHEGEELGKQKRDYILKEERKGIRNLEEGTWLLKITEKEKGNRIK
jgi:hypothetical protein